MSTEHESRPLPLIVAHRGASVFAPENTISAFRAALDAGAEGIEFDVRLSRDGVPVVIHDPNLKRTAGIRARVSEMTAAELAAADVAAWFFGPAHARPHRPEGVPTLAAVLDLLSGYRGRIYVELKAKHESLAPLVRAVCRTLDDRPVSGEVIVKSFRLPVIQLVRRFRPGTRTAALFAPRVLSILRKEKHLAAIAAELGADELSIHYSLATRKLMERARKYGMPVTAWTLDRPIWAARAAELGISAIITNDPALMLAARRSLPFRKAGP